MLWRQDREFRGYYRGALLRSYCRPYQWRSRSARADIISTGSCSLLDGKERQTELTYFIVEFDHGGDYLATGDKGGRVVLFERNDSKKGCEYKFYTEFQSHEPEFDYLKSLEIEEKINRIRWCRRGNQAHFLLSTNGASVSPSFRRVLPD